MTKLPKSKFIYIVAGIDKDGMGYALCYRKNINTKTGKKKREYFWKSCQIKVGDHLEQPEFDALVKECRWKKKKVEIGLYNAPYEPGTDQELEQVATWWPL
jgi:hypothetical protein